MDLAKKIKLKILKGLVITYYLYLVTLRQYSDLKENFTFLNFLLNLCLKYLHMAVDNCHR